MQRLFLLLSVSALLLLSACQHEGPIVTQSVVVQSAAEIPDDPMDPRWQDVPEYRARLILQDLVEPRLLAPSTQELRVRGMVDAKALVLRLSWDDPDRDDLPKTDGFFDACAVQIPVAGDVSLPAPQMGEPGRPVSITYWNASWQAAADGREDSITAIYPNARIDHYPFQAHSLPESARPEVEKRYSPARAAQNPVSGPHKTAVQDMLAEGPGTISVAARQSSSGRGVRSAEAWVVVLRRELPAELQQGAPGTQIAFAVWQGANDEVGARKMRTGWVPINRGK